MRGLWTAGALGICMAMALPAAAGVQIAVGVAIRDDGHREAGHEARRAWRDTGPAWRYGYDRGWRDGSESGHRDARRRREPDLRRHDDFRDADNGYKHWMGRRLEFSDGYREGFAAGYRRAYLATRPSWSDHARPRWEADRHPYPDFDRR
jgi:hypothetical protein